MFCKSRYTNRITFSFPDFQYLWAYFEKSQEVGQLPSSNVIFFAEAFGFGGFRERRAADRAPGIVTITK